MLTCRFIDDFSAIPPLAETWDQLLARSDFNDVFASCGFARAWWKAYGQNRKPWIGVVEDEAHQVRLIAPMRRDLNSSHLEIIGGVGSDYGQFVHAQGDRDSVACLFNSMRRRRGWKTFETRCLPTPSPVLDFFATQPKKTLFRPAFLGVMPSTVGLRQMHPIMNRERLESMAGLLQQESHRKHVNWFSRRGNLNYGCATKPREILAALPELIRMHVAEWAARGDPSQFLEKEHQHFYESLVEELGASGVVRMDLLALDERIIAAHFGFTWNGRIHYYKPAFDPEFSSHSPGKLLLAHIIREAVTHDVRELDMLFGLEQYKSKYSSEIRTTGVLQVWRSRGDQMLMQLKERISRRLRRD